jgi:hypothetical protein
VEPSSWYLLQVIERLVELTHQLRVSRVNQVDGLRALDRLSVDDVEEDILDVELVHKPTLVMANVRTIWTVVGFMTGLKVLS